MTVKLSSNTITATDQLLNQFLRAEWMSDLSNRLLRSLDNEPKIEAYLSNLANPSVKSLIVAALFKETRKPVIFVCSSPQSVMKYRYELRQFLPDERVIAYPTEDFSPYDLSPIPVESLKEQYHIL